MLCYVIGLLALVTVAHGNSDDIFAAFIALPVGSLGFAILAARELDQSFADVYSTAVSVQNLRPLWDRRVLAGLITVLTTAGALWLNIADYENFLTLLGSVFVPMSAVLIVDYFAFAAAPALGPVGLGPLPLADAAPVGRGIRHLPAHQPRVRVLVGVGVDVFRAGHRLHPGQLDVGVDPVVLRVGGAHAAGRVAGAGYSPANRSLMNCLARDAALGSGASRIRVTDLECKCFRDDDAEGRIPETT